MRKLCLIIVSPYQLRRTSRGSLSEVGVMLVLEIDQTLCANFGSLNAHFHRDVVTEGIIGFEVQRSGDHLAAVDCNGVREKKSALIPMGTRALRCSR